MIQLYQNVAGVSSASLAVVSGDSARQELPSSNTGDL